MKIITNNKVDLSLLDELFYKQLFNEIFNNKNIKEKKYENSSNIC